jgi:hypothetical protein
MINNETNYTYFSQSGNLFSVVGYKHPSFIRNITNNYKRFFFGTINTNEI